ncbi:hypothetical protein FTX61_20215 [Nitriliruptoraceae bacterium ZYF776]|nr:hypothetical protein [Profundirhabdus halotolerans]
MPYIAGVGVVRPDDPTDLSLEEVVFEAAAAALDDAGLTRADIDGVSIGASDQQDGRAISSMHLAGPAGSYLLDECKVTDDGACALALSVLRIEAGMSSKVLTVSWTKPSASPFDAAIGVNPEPTFARPVGLHPTVAEAVWTRRFLDAHSIVDDALDGIAQGESDELIATPLRRWHVPAPTEAAVAMVITADASDVQIAGLAWGADHPDPTRRADVLGSLPHLAVRAYREAGLTPHAELAVETTDRTVFRLASAATGLGLADGREAAAAVAAGELPNLNRSGGLWVSNPPVAAGLERVVEAARRIREGENAAVAHSSYGAAGQGNAVTVLRPAA